jgi:hypothetical protein
VALAAGAVLAGLGFDGPLFLFFGSGVGAAITTYYYYYMPRKKPALLPLRRRRCAHELARELVELREGMVRGALLGLFLGCRGPGARHALDFDAHDKHWSARDLWIIQNDIVWEGEASRLLAAHGDVFVVGIDEDIVKVHKPFK